MKILNFGSCNIDYVYEVSHIVLPGETADSQSLVKFPGGKGLNQSIALSRSGASVYHAGCIGYDGGFLREELQNAGVNTKYLKTEQSSTGHAIIQLDKNGENSIILYRGTNYMIDTAYIDYVFEDFGADDTLVLQNEISNLEYIISKGYEKKMRIVLNPSPYTEIFKNIDLSKISLLILNTLEAYDFSGEKEPERIRDYFSNKYNDLEVILTLGSNGSIYFHKDKFEYCPAYNVVVQDTTSAGDTFTGYFISGLLEGKNIKRCLQYASVAAALVVSKKGASVSIPLKEEVTDSIKYLKPNDTHLLDAELKKEKIINYINNNLISANLNDLAKELNYSPSYISAWIKKNFGTSFSDILQDERCKRASKLLKETRLSINEIISLCGYCNESFFRNLFKKVYGKTPFEYRKSYREGEK